jgi:hypothetical protein
LLAFRAGPGLAFAPVFDLDFVLTDLDFGDFISSYKYLHLSYRHSCQYSSVVTGRRTPSENVSRTSLVVKMRESAFQADAPPFSSFIRPSSSSLFARGVQQFVGLRQK